MSEGSAAGSSFVIDASVAAKWHLPDEDHRAEAVALGRRFVAGECELIAPEHIRYEVANAITMATRRIPARISPEQASAAIDDFFSVSLPTFGDDGLLKAAYPLAVKYGCAFYDAVYLALALRTGSPLVTADRRFYRRVQHLALVIWIGNLQIP